ncbi:hypothetical protein OS176_07805 [Xanthomonadaceae bacterium XH05]|nr:hypothetical protein [Xanthomonadaceae bacterium XH05]
MKMCSLSNALICDAARITVEAVLQLDAAGLTVREVQIQGRKPLVRIDPPPSASFIKGALRRRITQGGVRRTVYASLFHGATIEWEISEPRGAQAVFA